MIDRSRPMSPVAGTLYDMLRAGAPGAPALIGTDGSVLSYGDLLTRVDVMAAHLHACGVGMNDRIAIVLPNGPLAAVAFLAAARAGIACPLNPGFRAADFDFALADLAAKILITGAGADCAAAVSARALGIRCIDPAALDVPQYATAPAPPAPVAAAVALILHTSGTTARPKMVPLTHENLHASAINVARTLQLSAADRCLNIMPLFHIHGLVGALLASLHAGASVVCCPGFVAPDVFEQLRAYRPSWYTAVPTMHQAIVARAEVEPAPAALRFVRSSSAPLAPSTARALERLFAAPIIEAYGMTEAAHQMCSNPLAPGSQRYGSVGIAAGPQVTILDERGALVPPGSVGEVAIRGANVTAGYLGADASLDAATFAGSWFRTGDLGRFDDDGYLYLEGRIKELINRGGEKIAPREIDEALLRHPDVAQAVAFAMPDPRLGEEVAAAVVLHRAAALAQPPIDERALIRFAADLLADWKVPRRIAIVDDLPKGPTGKLVRIGLADRLGLVARPAASSQLEPARMPSGYEPVLAEIWCDVLKIPAVTAGDDFLALGGDSVLAGQVIARVRQRCGRELSIVAFFAGATVVEMAAAVAGAPVSA